MNKIDQLIFLATSRFPMLDIPDLEPDFSPPPVQAGIKLANQILAGGTLAALIAAIACAILLMYGGLDSRNKSKAWVALGICAVGVCVLGSISGFLTFFSNIPLF